MTEKFVIRKFNNFHMVEQINPGSVVSIKTNEDSEFLYAFMALEASIKGWKHCMPVIIVDGTFLKGLYGGTLLSGSTQDVEGTNIFILFNFFSKNFYEIKIDS